MAMNFIGADGCKIGRFYTAINQGKWVKSTIS